MTYVEGMIIQHTWGYGQTNQDFYEIVKRTKKTVLIRELKVDYKINKGEFMVGMCTPKLGEYVDELVPKRMRVFWRDGEERLHPQFGWMKIWDGEPQRWTGYY